MAGKMINLNTGEMAIGCRNDIITTGGVGSCLVVCLYDRKNRIGGMAHSMFPRMAAHKLEANGSDPKYVDGAIRGLIDMLMRQGSNLADVSAKIIGGANIFANLSIPGKKGIGELNIESAKEECARLGIAIIKKDVGGNGGKKVEFHLGNGLVCVNLTI